MVTVDREAWAESLRAEIDHHLADLRHDTEDRDPRMEAVFQDVVTALRACESRLAWLRYVAEVPSSAFDAGDAGALARAEARPLSPAV